MKKTVYLFISLIITISAMGQSAKEFYTSGLIKFKGESYKEAIADFSKAIKKNSKYFEAYIMKGRCYEKMDANKKALKEYSKVIKINPKYTKAYNLKGQLHKKMKDYDLAITDFSYSLKIKKDPFVYLYRANTYYLMEYWEKSIADYQKALEKLPNNQYAKFQIISIYIIQKKYKKALTSLSDIIVEDPNIAKAYLLRADIYHKQNKNDLACKDLSEAYRLGNAKAEQLIKDWCGSK